MNIEVCNKRSFPNEWLDDPHTVYIGRPSPLGNPYTIGRHGTRDEVITKYREYLYAAAEVNVQVRNALDAIEQLAKTNNVRLVCWCAPLPCHGNVIIEWLEDRL